MVDIHSHILYGLDDGAETLEESVAMVRMATEAGTTDIVATPHANLEYDFDPDLIEQRIQELGRAAGGDAARIHRGCDFHLAYDNIQDALANPTKYTINHKKYLLVEFSDLAIFHTTTDIFRSLLNAGMIPVITHPERNKLLQKRIAELQEWTEMGCLLQVTAQSFLGRWGNAARDFSHELMKRRMVHVVASDAHDTERRPPVLDDVHKFLAKQYGPEAADWLLAKSPAAILEGNPLPEAPTNQERKWYQFWS
jgi:protein-tyrosine phosphatase